MVIKEISKLCQRRRTAVIYDDYCRRTQWISDERTFYPTFGLPRLDTETLPYVLDIPEGKQVKMLFDRNVELPDQLNFSDYDDTEQVLPRAGATVGFRNEVFLPVRTSLGLMFIDPEQLKPLKDIEAEIELYERVAKNGEPYIVAKRGLGAEGGDPADLPGRAAAGRAGDADKGIERIHKPPEDDGAGGPGDRGSQGRTPGR